MIIEKNDKQLPCAMQDNLLPSVDESRRLQSRLQNSQTFILKGSSHAVLQVEGQCRTQSAPKHTLG